MRESHDEPEEPYKGSYTHWSFVEKTSVKQE